MSASIRPAPPPRPTPLPVAIDFPLAISALLSPLLRLLQFRLHRVMVDGCGLMDHLEAIEGLFLQRKGECVADWSDKIWTKVSQPWPSPVGRTECGTD
jgi:gamma-tubulin complex component 5